MSKPRADRITVTEVDARVATVAKAQIADRERLLSLEKENAELRESVAALTKVANAPVLPEGYYEANGDVFDRRENTFDGHVHVGIMDKGKFVPGVPQRTVIGEDGAVYFDKHHPVLGRQRLGYIAEGVFHDESDKWIAEAREQNRQQDERRIKRIHEENARVQEERKGIWVDVFGIKRIGAEGRQYIPNADPAVEAVLRESQRHHRAFLESNGVENLRPLPDDD